MQSSHKIIHIDDSLLSLFETQNICMIRLLIFNELITLNDISNCINTYCKKNICAYDFFIDIIELFIDINVDVAVLQVIFTHFLCISARIQNECLSIIYKLMGMGATISADANIAYLLPDKLFFEHVALNNDIVDQKLEIECAKYKSYSVLEYVQNIMMSEGILLSDPLIIFLEAYCTSNRDVYIAYLQKIKYDIIPVKKMLFMLDLETFKMIFDNTMLDAELTLFILVKYQACTPTYILEFLDPDVMKYINFDFYGYFVGGKNHGIYSDIWYCCRSTEYTLNILTNDEVYMNLIGKLSSLLNILRQDDPLST